jgi:hypothetical protein
MTGPRYCVCPAPRISTDADNVRFCEHCGERENPLTVALAQALAGPLAELRAEFRALLREAAPAEPGATWVDLATEASRVGRSREYMRRFARELGGVQRKPRGRWYFNPPTTDARLTALEGGEAKSARPAPPGRPLPESVPLLDVKGRAA